jgi:hypothetical protein
MTTLLSSSGQNAQNYVTPKNIINLTYVNYELKWDTTSKTSTLRMARSPGNKREIEFPEDGILHSHRRENLRSYIALPTGLCSGDVICFL